MCDDKIVDLGKVQRFQINQTKKKSKKRDENYTQAYSLCV